MAWNWQESFRDILGLNILSPQIPIDADINVPTYNTETSYTPTITDSRSTQITDQRQMIIAYYSPGSEITTKKSDRAGSEASPLITGATTQQQAAGSTVPVEIPINMPTFDFGSMLFLGLIGAGVYLWVTKGK